MQSPLVCQAPAARRAGFNITSAHEEARHDVAGRRLTPDASDGYWPRRERQVSEERWVKRLC
ncbi:MAG TPA: hypothetical protein VMG58_16770, partial [Candidatus Sulfotelmatobacter sp.]|nr:hypothetical protein [Candidatus Sulfotelmatobacter sp.]